MGARGVKKERTLEDLKEILDRVSMLYLGHLLPEVVIKWGRYRKPQGPRKVINLGLYFWESKVIQIHPVLRRRWVPDFFVEYVVYHEVLHHSMSPDIMKYAKVAKTGTLVVAKTGAQVELHPEIFQLAEKLFAKYDEAIQWEEKHIDRLLAS